MTRSRNRRCTRVETVRRNQVAVADEGQPDGGQADAVGVAVEHAFAEQLEPQREQRVGQRRQQREQKATSMSAGSCR